MSGICRDPDDFSQIASLKEAIEMGKCLATLGLGPACKDADDCKFHGTYEELCKDQASHDNFLKSKIALNHLANYGCFRKIDDDTRPKRYRSAFCTATTYQSDTIATDNCQAVFGPEFVGTFDDSCGLFGYGRMNCWQGNTLGDKEQCCIHRASTAGTCNPDYLNDSTGECDEIMGGYCQGYNIFHNQRCREWGDKNPKANDRLKQQYCNMADRVDRNISGTGTCRKWCKDNPGKCDTGVAEYCKTLKPWEFDILCSCVRSPLIEDEEAAGQPQCFDPVCNGAATGGMPGYVTKNMDADCGILCNQKIQNLGTFVTDSVKMACDIEYTRGSETQTQSTDVDVDKAYDSLVDQSEEESSSLLFIIIIIAVILFAIGTIAFLYNKQNIRKGQVEEYKQRQAADARRQQADEEHKRRMQYLLEQKRQATEPRTDPIYNSPKQDSQYTGQYERPEIKRMCKVGGHTIREMQTTF